MQNSFLSLQKDSVQDKGHSSAWSSISEDSPQGEWDKMAEKMMLTFAESGHPVFRATSPLSRSQLKSKGGGKMSIHYCANQDAITTIFRTIVSVNQLSLYGVVAEMCEELKLFMIDRGNLLWWDNRVLHLCQAWSRQTCRWIMMIVLTKIFYCKDMENELNCHNKTNWANFVWMQDSRMLLKSDNIFMTNDTAEFSQFTDAVACRENTLPRDEETSEPKGWITGNTQIGPVLEVTFLMASTSWSRIWTTTTRKLRSAARRICIKIECGWFCKPIQRRDSASSSTRTIPIGERTWTDVEPRENSTSDYEMSKKLIHLLRHDKYFETKMERLNSGESRTIFKTFLVLSSLVWREVEEKHGKKRRNKKRHQYCTDSPGAILYLRALQSHSWRSLIDPTLKENLIIPDGFFQYIYVVQCAINLHSIINSGLILGGQNLKNRQTVFFQSVDPWTILKNHDVIDLNVPRHAQYLHNAWKRHQDAVYWVDINLALKKGLKFYKKWSNVVIHYETLPA